MAAEFLADPNEDQMAADFYMEKFRKEGTPEGGELSLAVFVTMVPAEKLNAVEASVRSLYECSRIERGESGFIFKKPKITAILKPIKFERDELLKAARALYRIILEHEVTVRIERA